jgi:hypothetical protein
MRFVNVRAARDAYARRTSRLTGAGGMVDDDGMRPATGAPMSTEVR